MLSSEDFVHLTWRSGLSGRLSETEFGLHLNRHCINTTPFAAKQQVRCFPVSLGYPVT